MEWKPVLFSGSRLKLLPSFSVWDFVPKGPVISFPIVLAPGILRSMCIQLVQAFIIEEAFYVLG